MTNLQIRIDGNIKKSADELFVSLGLDTQTAIRIFIQQAIENNGLPFPVRHNNGYSLLQAIDDSRNRINLTGPFDSAENAVNSMLAD